jgi:hypothetical protein
MGAPPRSTNDIKLALHASDETARTMARSALGRDPHVTVVDLDATVIVPERHILFMVAWYTRAKVSLTPDAIPYAERVRMMPLAFIGKDSPLEAALDRARTEPGVTPPLGFHPRYRNGLVLVTEPTWDWMLAQLPPDVGAYWARWPTI